MKERMYRVKKEKQYYIEYLRVIACIAVIVIHSLMTLPNNFTVDELGKYPFTVFNSAHMLVNWSVPVFFMISGALLIPKQLRIKKIGKYVIRMFIVLLIFGVGFAFLELLFNRNPISISTLGKSILLTLQGKTWSHMWYIYALIGIYLILIPLSRGIQNLSLNELRIFVGTLIIGYCIINSISVCTGLSIINYMQLKNQILWFVLGYYVTIEPCLSKIRHKALCYSIAFVCGGIIKFSLMWFWIYKFGETMPFLNTLNLFDLIQAIGVFLFVKIFVDFRNLHQVSPVVASISRCSFAIYVIHPVFENLFYKVLGFTPLVMPIWIGIFVVSALIFVLSWLTSIILIRIPVLNRIL